LTAAAAAAGKQLCSRAARLLRLAAAIHY